MSPEASTLEIRAWPRALDRRPLPRRVDGGLHPVVTVADFGREFDKSCLHINVARCDPWFVRAAEVSPGTRYADTRPRVYGKLLQLFALAKLERAQGKLSLPSRWERLLFTTSTGSADPEARADDGEEVISGHLLQSAGGRAAVQFVRDRFIAGEASSLLAGSDYRLVPLIERALVRS